MNNPNCTSCNGNVSAQVGRVYRTSYENTAQPVVMHNKAVQSQQNSYQQKVNMILQAQTSRNQQIANQNSSVTRIRV